MKNIALLYTEPALKESVIDPLQSWIASAATVHALTNSEEVSALLGQGVPDVFAAIVPAPAAGFAPFIQGLREFAPGLPLLVACDGGATGADSAALKQAGATRIYSMPHTPESIQDFLLGIAEATGLMSSAAAEAEPATLVPEAPQPSAVEDSIQASLPPVPVIEPFAPEPEPTPEEQPEAAEEEEEDASASLAALAAAVAAEEQESAPEEAPAPEPTAETAPVPAPAASDTPAPESSFTGLLPDVALEDVLSLVSYRQRSLVVELNNGTDTGYIFFEKGLVQNAMLGEDSGRNAFYAILAWPTGKFQFYGYTAPPESSINLSLQQLIEERP